MKNKIKIIIEEVFYLWTFVLFKLFRLQSCFSCTTLLNYYIPEETNQEIIAKSSNFFKKSVYSFE